MTSASVGEPCLLQDLASRAAATSPNAPAIHHGDRTVTYGQLEELIDRGLCSLHGLGVRRGARVLIWAEKSAEVIAVMQATLRAGAIYVPVAPSNPLSRVRQIAAECEPTIVVVDGERRSGIGSRAVTVTEVLANNPAVPVAAADMHPNDPAYILFTSGSTGTPKGVTVTHANALAFVLWATETVGVTSQDRLSSHAPFNFDLSVFDLYAALAAGAAVDLIGSESASDGARLAGFVRDRGISVWYSVPSALMLMMDAGGLLTGPPPPNLRTCILAGEPFPLAHGRLLLEAWADVRVLNWYGPTETNVCTSHEVTASDVGGSNPVPIGFPASGDTISLVPGPDVGEITVSGPSVMSGYWGRPPQAGPYATGDLGRIGTNGALEYVGRIDGMVKVRGHRVELGDIERVIGLHAAVQDVAVLVLGEAVQRRIRAVVVPRDGFRVSLLALKAHCAEHLPRYMVIDDLRLAPTIPRTPNGKTDRPRLTETHGGTK